jgi:transposase
MSVYVGIDVHRKRSQVAVVTEDGQVQLNKNTVNGTEPLLRLIGDLPAGTPVAFEAAFGRSWLADLLEDYGFEAHLVHPLRCKAIASARRGLAAVMGAAFRAKTRGIPRAEGIFGLENRRERSPMWTIGGTGCGPCGCVFAPGCGRTGAVRSSWR